MDTRKATEDQFAICGPEQVTAEAAEQRGRAIVDAPAPDSDRHLIATLPFGDAVRAIYRKREQATQERRARQTAEEEATTAARHTEVLREALETFGLGHRVTGPGINLDGVTLRGTWSTGHLEVRLLCPKCDADRWEGVKSPLEIGAALAAWEHPETGHRCPKPAAETANPPVSHRELRAILTESLALTDPVARTLAAAALLLADSLDALAR